MQGLRYLGCRKGNTEVPKIGMEPVRREALIEATIKEVGAHGSLNVTVSQIASRAGMSSGLAHHYFGGKDQIFMAAMRHILAVFGKLVRENLSEAKTPTARIEAVIHASLHSKHFEPEMVAAWLTFYVQAQNSNEAQRLLRIYAHRLHSNLMHDLKKLTSPSKAETTAHGIAALIDGFYIRHALKEPGPDRMDIIRIIVDFLHQQIGRP